MTNTLKLTLKKKWFDMILSGEKTEEYREGKPYWHKRLVTPETIDLPFPSYNKFDCVTFKNGYAKNAPTVTLKLKSIGIGQGYSKWGAEAGKHYYVIKLGKIIDSKNII